MTTFSPLPEITVLNRPFFEAAENGSLKLQSCQDCGEVIYYPRYVCPECSSRDLEWVDMSGRGTIYTFSLIYRPHHPSFDERIPIPLVVVKLDEGPLIISNIIDGTKENLDIGEHVKVQFKKFDDRYALPVFSLV